MLLRKLSTPLIGEKPHQPLSFKFPKREFGKTSIVKRSFQPQWFSRWPWLHYDEERDLAFCFTCVKAYNDNKLHGVSSLEYTYISAGFANWKDSSTRLPAHETTTCHKTAVLKTITLLSTTRDVGELLSAAHSQDRLERRQCFLKLLSNVRFLARQALPLRGDGDEFDSNYIQLLKLRGEDDGRVFNWIKKKTDKYTSADMQNEMIRVMARQVLREVTASLHTTAFYTIMADETTDKSNREQVVLCLRWVSDNFDVHEEFIGMYMVEVCDAPSLVSVIRDVLQRLNLTMKKVRGQCYDGASTMSGSKSGVATTLLREESRAVYTHCYGHALNLACADTVRLSKLMRDALDTTHEITKLIKKSPKRDTRFEALKSEMASDSPGIRVLCPTRWTVKAEALQSILSNYEVLQELWTNSLDVRDTEMRVRILGVASQMTRFNFYFGVSLGNLILRHSDNLSRTLQKTEISAAEGQEVATMTLQTLKTLRSDTNFKLFWEKVTKMAEKEEVLEPEVPRRKKVPRTIDYGRAEGISAATPEDYFRQFYFEALDLIISCINNRFDQQGFRVYRKVQDLLLKAVKNEDYSTELDFVTGFYGSDFQPEVLKTQLTVLSSNFTQSNPTLSDVIKFFKAFSPAQRDLLSEVCTLLKLTLVMPATNAVSERSFSALRRVKSYLRSTMTQSRLNDLLVLHIHRDLTDKLNLIDVANEFIFGHEHRQQIFGKFVQTDINCSS